MRLWVNLSHPHQGQQAKEVQMMRAIYFVPFMLRGIH